jgi:hypothetical protein
VSEFDSAAGAALQEGRPVSIFARLDSRIKKKSAGFVGIFIPAQISEKAATSKAVSHFQEDLMTNLWSSYQLIEHFYMLWTSR